jgi:hypothetical protein
MVTLRRRAFLSTAATAGAVLVFVTAADAAALLKPSGAAEPALVEQQLKSDKTVKRKRLVNVDLSVLAAEILPPSASKAGNRADVSRSLGGQVDLRLFSDVTVSLKRKRVEKAIGGGVVWTASAGGNSYGILVVNNGKVTGAIQYKGKSYLLEPTGRKSEHRVRETIPGAYPNDRHMEVASAPKSGGGKGGGKGGGGTTDTGGGGTTGGGTTTPPPSGSTLTVNLLAAYTSKANTLLGGLPADKIALDVAIVNLGFSNSGVPLHLNLAGVTPVSSSYDEGKYSDSTQPLRDLTTGTVANFPTIRNLRTSLGADFVTLYADRKEYCGLAWVNTGPIPDYAFSVINPACNGTPSLAHELGHNAGLRHDRYVEASAGSEFYNYGFVNTSGKFRDIMSYNNQCAALGFSCERITYYSNSAMTYNGFKLGVPKGTSGAADASRLLTEKAVTVSSFR